jgi:hypothetical protein
MGGCIYGHANRRPSYLYPRSYNLTYTSIAQLCSGPHFALPHPHLPTPSSSSARITCLHTKPIARAPAGPFYVYAAVCARYQGRARTVKEAAQHTQCAAHKGIRHSLDRHPLRTLHARRKHGGRATAGPHHACHTPLPGATEVPRWRRVTLPAAAGGATLVAAAAAPRGCCCWRRRACQEAAWQAGRPHEAGVVLLAAASAPTAAVVAPRVAMWPLPPWPRACSGARCRGIGAGPGCRRAAGRCRRHPHACRRPCCWD